MLAISFKIYLYEPLELEMFNFPFKILITKFLSNNTSIYSFSSLKFLFKSEGKIFGFLNISKIRKSLRLFFEDKQLILRVFFNMPSYKAKWASFIIYALSAAFLFRKLLQHYAIPQLTINEDILSSFESFHIYFWRVLCEEFVC